MSHAFEHDGWTFNSNSDLSGAVIITDPSEVGDGEMTIPAAALISFVANWVMRERIATLENATDAQVLGVEDGAPVWRP